MERIKHSIRKKILWSVLAIALIPIILQAFLTLSFTQQSMANQLIQNKTQKVAWVTDKLETELGKYKDFFYEIEIDKSLKNALLYWSLGDELSNTNQKKIRNIFESLLNTNSHIRTVEIYNSVSGNGYIADRVSFTKKEIDEKFCDWGEGDYQKNLVVQMDGTDFIICHQMTEFSSKKRIALIVVRLSKYAFSDIMEKDMEPEETAYIFNDRCEFLNQYGIDADKYQEIAINLFHDSEKTNKMIEKSNLFSFAEKIDKGKVTLIYLVSGRWIELQMKSTIMTAMIILAGCLVAVIFFSKFVSNIISQPIILLSQKIRKTDIHNFIRSEAITRKDEIGMLQESFEAMVRSNQKLVEQEYQKELEKQEAQLKALQAQINPHFLHNTLQVIGGMALTGKSKDIYPVVTALSDILRYAISFSEETVILGQELTYLESYLAIQNSRFNNRIIFEKNICDSTENACIPKLILQPIVENSLQHGLEGKSGEWRIKLCSYLEKETLVISVSDNGKGINPEKLKELKMILEKDNKDILTSSAHIGLGNVQARIRLQSGRGYGIEIMNEEKGGTTIIVRLKFKKQK